MLSLLTSASRRPWLLLLAAVIAALAQAGDARAAPAQEDLVKAAVVFKLTRYVDWPQESFAGDSSPLRLCVIGDTPVAEALETVDGRTSKGRVVEYVRVDSASAEDACHILYVAVPDVDLSGLDTAEAESGAEDGRASTAVLTVSDLPGFAGDGGMIELTRRGSRLGFRVNVGNAQSAGLVIAAPLLELAEIAR